MRRALVVVLALLAGTRAAEARLSLGGYARIMRMMGEWRVDEARAEIATLDKAGDGGSAEAHVLKANLEFLEGHYAKAVEELAAAKGGGRASEDARALEPLARSTAAALAGFTEATSPGGHFVVRYQPGKDEVLLPYAFATLEAAYQRIGEDIGERPASPVLVEIYPEVDYLAKVSSLTLKEIETSGTIALCKYDRVMITTPRALVRGYPWLDTLAHEYTHYLVTRASRDTVPIWLHEGLAKFEERRWREEPGGALTATMEHLLALALKKGRLITFDEMHPSMAKLPSQEAAATAFAEVYTAVEFLHKDLGYDGLRKVIAKLRDGESDQRAIGDTRGGGWDRFQGAWKRWLKDRGLKLHPNLVPEELEFKDARKKGGEDAGDAKALARVAENARKHARLGGMLRTRGRLKGAATEYERALELAKDDPFVSAKLARTYLELGRGQDAVQAAGPALEQMDELAGPHATVGLALLSEGDNAGAERELSRALGISPFDPAVHCGLEKVYKAIGDGREAQENKVCTRLTGDE